MSAAFTAIDLLSHESLLALPLAMVAGAVAALNPCCVAMYPAAAAVYCGTKPTDTCCGVSATMKRSLKSSIVFVFGVAAANTTLGIIAAFAGRVVGQLGPGVRYGVAAIPIVMGLHLVGWLRFPLGAVQPKFIANGWAGVFGAGFLLSLALTPCGTPVLASILSYVAYNGKVGHGAIPLFLYGFGSGLPMVLVGTTAGQLMSKLEKVGYGLWGGACQRHRPHDTRPVPSVESMRRDS